jgi:hypothetical protein
VARSPSDPFFSPKFLASFKICSGIAAFVMIAVTQTHRIVVADPAERDFWQRVMALQPAEVKSIQISRDDFVSVDEPRMRTNVRTLSPWEVSAFLLYLSSAEPGELSKPQVVKKYRVRIETKRNGPERVVEFDILDTRHSGIRVRRDSNSIGATMESDRVKPFLSFLFSEPTE